MTGKTRRTVLIFAAVAVAVGLGTSRTAPGATAVRRFFFSGDGTLTLQNAHNGERIKAHYRRADGSYDPKVLADLRHFLRSRGDNREGDLSLRLIEQLDYIEDLARPRRLLLDSGYRSPDYNGEIRARGGRVASTSLHTQGLAADLQFVGENTRRLWQRIRATGCCGVGYYKDGNFLHIDVGPPRFWEAATSKVDQNLSEGNARVFARTDFDRYQQLDGAVVQLYSVTAFPLRVAATAQVIGGPQPTEAKLAPAGDVEADGACLRIDGGNQNRFRITGSGAIPTGRRVHLQLSTCVPRIERTPEQIETNEFEVQENTDQ